MTTGPTDKQVIAAINRVQQGQHSRDELVKMRDNALAFLARGISDAQFLIDEINQTPIAPLHSHYLFMGFCPGATLENRQDEKWMSEGFCKFDFIESAHQYARFCKMLVGDIIILKKRNIREQTMRLYGHGIIKRAMDAQASAKKYYRVDWFKPEVEIEVPLMACNSTVDVRKIALVQDAMPAEFWDWLKSGTPTCPPQ